MDTLFDYNNNTCLSIKNPTIPVKVKFNALNGRNMAEFLVMVVGEAVECENTEKFYVSFQHEEGLNIFDGKFQMCKLMTSSNENGKDVCLYQCICLCTKVFIQSFNPNLRLCEITYP